MNLNNAKKTWINVKKATGEYVTYLFKTLASLVYLEDGTTVEYALNNITAPTFLSSSTFYLNSSVTVTGIKNLLIISFKNSEEVGRHSEILIPLHDNTRRISIVEDLSTQTGLCMKLSISWESSSSVTITCDQFNPTGLWINGVNQLADFYTI